MDIKKAVKIEPGRYVLAVSGGVDSMVLLDVLRQHPKVRLTVAHFDHGIRQDSHMDRQLVERISKQHALPFVYALGELGEGTSENTARQARYSFLRSVQDQIGAKGIITAHHMDDVIETATHNIMRGTGRKGMSSLKSIDGIMRPLLHVPKQKLVTYAQAHNLEWREDSTNQDLSYKRNYIRHKILPRIQKEYPESYASYKMLIRRQHDLNQAIDTMLSTILHVQPATNTLRRYDVIRLPHAVATELVGEWLRQNGKRDFTRKQIERATAVIKTAQPFTTFELDKSQAIKIAVKTAKIVNV